MTLEEFEVRLWALPDGKDWRYTQVTDPKGVLTCIIEHPKNGKKIECDSWEKVFAMLIGSNGGTQVDALGSEPSGPKKP